MYFVGCAGIYLMTAISIERYYVIYKPMSIKKITFKFKIMSIVVCLLLGLLWPVLPLFGWSHYTLEGGLTSCAVEWAERSFNVVSYNVTIWVGGFVLPLLVISFTSFKLICFVRILLYKKCL